MIILVIKASTLGSRSLEQRQKSLKRIISLTIIFVIYINVPIGILYFESLDGNYNIDIYGITKQLMDFIQLNSFVIFTSMIYLGITKKITGKNDLPTYMQGKYLIKCAFVILLAANLIPLAINFLI